MKEGRPAATFSTLRKERFPKPQTPNSRPQTPEPKPQTSEPKTQIPNPKPQPPLIPQPLTLSQMESKDRPSVINEICELRGCNAALYFEVAPYTFN